MNLKFKVLVTLITAILLCCESRRNKSKVNYNGNNTPFVSDFMRCIYESMESKGPPHPFIGLPIDEVITRQGYPVEEIKVTTEDGYILSVYRIPYSKKSPRVAGRKKRAVYLNHGLAVNAHEFLIQWGNQNLALLLADSDFDVFLSNARGTKYSLGHVDPNITSQNYWNFSFHEMARYDVPAVISKILNVTQEERLYYIGHSMGTTEFMVALSEIPELNQKIHVGFLLTPAGFMNSSSLQWLATLVTRSKDLDKSLVRGQAEFLEKIYKNSSSSPYLSIPTTCNTMIGTCMFCNNFYYTVGGYNGEQANFTEVPLLLSLFPEVIGMKNLVHFGQIIEYKTFRRFDYGSVKNKKIYGIDPPKDYNLSQITAQTVIFYSKYDELCVPKDVEYTVSKFGPGSVQKMIFIDDKDFSHADFGVGKNARKLVFDKIISYIRENEVFSSVDVRRR